MKKPLRMRASRPQGWVWFGAAVAVTLLAFQAVSAVVPQTMSAIIASGGMLTLQTVSVPHAGPGQVLIRVRAASVNPVDWKIADHAAPGSQQIPGKDLSGTVEEVGANVSPWQRGDAVIAISTSGAYAQYVAVDARSVAAKPRHMSFAEAAGMGIAAETAWRAMVDAANVQAGQRVLIHGAAGGVGSAAVQIAKAAGAYVIATASAGHASMLRKLGADEIIDYRSVRFEEHVKGVDVVLNTVDADTGARSIGIIKPDGILVSVVGATSADACRDAKIRCMQSGRITGERLSRLSELADTGKFKVVIDRRFPLKEAAAAWTVGRQGHTGGKSVLIVAH